MKKGREIDQPIVSLTPTLLEQLEKNKPSGGFKLPQGYLSPSQIDMYLRCPRQYYFRSPFRKHHVPLFPEAHCCGCGSFLSRYNPHST